MKNLIELARQYWHGVILGIITMVIMNQVLGAICPSVLLFGIPCPACGITRATRLLLTGHFRESLAMHPLLPLAILEFVFLIIIKNKLKNYRFFINCSVIICMVIFVSFYIYRMKMYFPDVEPMMYRQDNYLHRLISIYHKVKLHE